MKIVIKMGFRIKEKKEFRKYPSPMEIPFYLQINGGISESNFPRETSIFPILPNNWTLLSNQIVNSGFYYWNNRGDTGTQQVNFGLNKKKVNKHFSMNAIGDVQVGNSQELDYVSRSLWPELLQADSSSFNLFLGDLVNNKLNLFSVIKQMMELLPAQSWTVIGNHDRDADSIRINQTFSYNTAFVSTYAFTEGNVHSSF